MEGTTSVGHGRSGRREREVREQGEEEPPGEGEWLGTAGERWLEEEERGNGGERCRKAGAGAGARARWRAGKERLRAREGKKMWDGKKRKGERKQKEGKEKERREREKRGGRVIFAQEK